LNTTPGTRRPLVERSERGLIVTSETIAQGADLQHKNTLELINRHHLSLERFGQVAFETRPGYNNSQIRVALLNEQQATLLMTFMRNTERVVEFKVQLIEAFYEMAKLLATPERSPMTEDDIVAQALQITSARVKALENKVAEDAPKVDYVDTFVADEDLMTFRTLASDLKIGEHELRAILLDRKWIYKQESSRWSESKQRKEPIYRYSAMADKKNYFHAVLAHDAPRFRGEVMHTLKLTPEGAVAVTRLIGQMRRAADSLKSVEGPAA